MSYKKAEPSFCLGDHTFRVPMSLFANNRKRLCDRLGTLDDLPENSVALLQGGEQKQQDSTDKDLCFRQESFFHWCFGVLEPGCYGAIDVKTGKTVLFIPKLPEEYKVWMGDIYPPSHFLAKYAVDEVKYVCDMKHVLEGMKVGTLLTLQGVNIDSGLPIYGARFDGISNFKENNAILHPNICECRVIKSEMELEVLRYVHRVSSEAHKEIIRRIRPGWMEYQAESLFLHYIYMNGGCRHVGYPCMATSGPNAAILRYGRASHPNGRKILDGDMCMFDMAGEYCCYNGDITCSFPVNGKFTEDQKAIYNAVLKANRAVQKALKPGVSWVDMHLLAQRVELEELKKIGVIHGDVDEMMKVRLGALFMPHGVGHFLGLDVEDVGGYPEGGPKRPTDLKIRMLQTARTMEVGMVITIEPGIYFNWPMIKDALNNPEWSPFINEQVIRRFQNFGGVRIEDSVAITRDGMEMLTCVPRDVEEIEALAAEGRSDPSPPVGTLLPNPK